MPIIKTIDSYYGNIMPSNPDVPLGGNITFNFEPNTGCFISKVWINNKDMGNIESYMMQSVEEGFSVYVEFYPLKRIGETLAYNKYETMLDIGYKTIEQLIFDNDNLWKLLKYNTPDALNRDFLTLAEKSSMVYSGIGDSTNFRVFKSPFLDDAIKDQQSQFRVYVASIKPVDRSKGLINIAFECVTHIKSDILNNYNSRLERMVYEVISTLNGTEVGGIGNFFFDDDGSFFDVAKLNVYNNRNYFGFTLIMSCWVGDLSD